MWGPYMWTHGWIFPLMGFAICLGFLVLAFRSTRTGGGFGCMGGHGHAHGSDAAELRPEIDALREEIRRLKAAR